MANVSNKCASCKYITNSLQESPCMSCMPICGAVSHYESISGWQSGTSGNGGAGTVEICCSGSGEKKKKNEAESSHPDWEAKFKKAELEKKELQIKLNCAEKDADWMRNQLIYYRAIAETVEVIFGRKAVK